MQQNQVAEEKVAREQAEREFRWAREQEEKDQKRQTDKEKLLREDASRKDTMEKQRLLSMLEWPLINLLDRLGLRDDLSLPLAQAKVLSLSNLRNLDQVTLAQTLGLDELAKSTGRTDLERLCGLAILSARRDLAMAAVEQLILPEDEAWQKQTKEAETKATADAVAAPWASNFKSTPTMSLLSSSEPERKSDGPLRKQLLTVTERWHEYLATMPTLGSMLSADDNATPSWKDTVAWALWMLTSRTLGKKYGDAEGWMCKDTIESYIKFAKEYVWGALYPAVKTFSRGEWRLYWKRVQLNFEGFFSDKGRQRWAELAAANARADAINAGKSPIEQETAAKRGVAMVACMLRTRPLVKQSPRSASRLHSSPRRGQLLLQQRQAGGSTEGTGCTPGLRRSLSFGDARQHTKNPFGGGISLRSGSPGSFRPSVSSASPTPPLNVRVRSRESRMSGFGLADRNEGSFASQSEDADPALVARRTAAAQTEARLKEAREIAAKAAREELAKEAAAQHKGRRGSIAAAAATAAAIVREQQIESEIQRNSTARAGRILQEGDDSLEGSFTRQHAGSFGTRRASTQPGREASHRRSSTAAARTADGDGQSLGGRLRRSSFKRSSGLGSNGTHDILSSITGTRAKMEVNSRLEPAGQRSGPLE